MVGAVAALGWLGAGVAQAGTSATATFSSPGPSRFTVPTGVTSITVTAVGAAGGSCSFGKGSAGGAGAAVTATVPVVPDQALFVGVGSPGAPCGDSGGGGAGGRGGSGAGTNGGLVGGAGGGGVSLVGVARPSPSFAGLLVVAGGGGGAGQLANGGGAGSAGQTPSGSLNGGGGGPGTSTAGGTGGSGQNGANGVSGSFGIGGSGGPCQAEQPGPGPAGAAGGGGGYFGGGGGGCGALSGGGGGGSSSVTPDASNVSMALSSAAPSVSLTYAVPTADEGTTTMRFGTQAPGTAGPAQTLIVTNNGSAPLVVSGVVLGGSDPGDFLVGGRCQQPVAPGSSCQVGVRFHPQLSGARSATLTLLTNAASAPQPVALAGGVSELLACRPTIEVNEGGATAARTEMCTGKLVRRTVKLTTTSTRARIVRRRLVFATGASAVAAHGGYKLMLTERRPLTRGAYTLILGRRHGRGWITQRLLIILR
jgi:hypothetical protein